MNIRIRFYEELNDFLPPHRKKVTFSVSIAGDESVKQLIESLGVPHCEVDMILINSEPVDFSRLVQSGDMISVYPVFESFDISTVSHLHPRPLRDPRFISDVHLGKLSRLLRLLGFDTLYQNDYEDRQIVRLALQQNRTILTRDRGLLKIKEVERGYWIRTIDPTEQIKEVVKRFDLFSLISPFSRCLLCGNLLIQKKPEELTGQLPPYVATHCAEFHYCSQCHKPYWKGTHYKKMKTFIHNLFQDYLR